MRCQQIAAMVASVNNLKRPRTSMKQAGEGMAVAAPRTGLNVGEAVWAGKVGRGRGTLVVG